MIEIAVHKQQSTLLVDESRLRAAVCLVLEGAAILSAEISLAIVDDHLIHQLNHTYLDHDYPTDVLSFLLKRNQDHLEGEIVASAETAIRSAKNFNWSPAEELLLYVVHGALHLVGHDDQTSTERALMRSQEKFFLGRLGLPTADELPNGNGVDAVSSGNVHQVTKSSIEG